MSFNRFRSVTRQRIAARNAAFRSDLAKRIKPVAERQVRRYKDVVANWEHKPIFVYEIVISKDGLTITIEATGDHAMLWVWVDQGTKPHVIVPKTEGGYLKFQTGFTPKTVPGGFGGIGGSSGTWVSVKQVNHPGTQARNFGKLYTKIFRRERKQAIDNAFRSANRRR